jgi:SHS2 domain-containing protein
MARPRFRLLPHTADARLAVWGDSETELLANAVAGALRCACGGPARGPVRCWYRLPLPRALPERLVRTVNEALFLLFARRELVVAVRSSRGGAALGVSPLPAGRTPATEVKAATFHALRPVRSPRLGAVLTLDL